jgi:hypothetical protein
VNIKRSHAFDYDEIVMCHRSAYDFLFGPECSVPWLVQNLDTEQLAKKTLNGFKVHHRCAPFLVQSVPPFTSGFFHYTREAIAVAKTADVETTEHLFEWLDDLHNGIPVLFPPPHTGVLDRQALCDRLSGFWRAVAIHVVEYVERRWDRVLREPRAIVLCSTILGDLYRVKDKHPSLYGRLLENLRKTHRQPTVTSTVRPRLVEAGSRSEQISTLLSWDASGGDYGDDEACIFRNIGRAFTFGSYDDAYEYLALMHESHVYCGILRRPLDPYQPLQLLVSDMALHLYSDDPYAFRPIAPDQSTSNSEPSSTRYRMVCLPPDTQHPFHVTGNASPGCHQPFNMSMDGLFDLGAQSTKALL